MSCECRTLLAAPAILDLGHSAVLKPRDYIVKVIGYIFLIQSPLMHFLPSCTQMLRSAFLIWTRVEQCPKTLYRFSDRKNGILSPLFTASCYRKIVGKLRTLCWKRSKSNSNKITCERQPEVCHH